MQHGEVGWLWQGEKTCSREVHLPRRMTFDDFVKYFVTVALCHLVDSYDYVVSAARASVVGSVALGRCQVMNEILINNEYIYFVKHHNKQLRRSIAKRKLWFF